MKHQALLFLLTILACINATAQEVTLDFTTNTWNLPTSDTRTTKTYTNGTYTITLSGTYKLSETNGNSLMLIGKGSYIKLPKFNFDVEKIEIVGAPYASKNATLNVFTGSTASTAISTEIKGLAESGTPLTKSFDIDEAYQAAGNIYSIKTTSANDARIATIKIYKKGSSEAPAATTTTFGSDVDDKVFTIQEGGTASWREATVTPAEAEGTMTYSSSNTSVAQVDAAAKTVTLTGTTGEAVITATFTPTDATKWQTSSASYTLLYQTRAATTLSFAKTTDTALLDVAYTLPALTLKSGTQTLADKPITLTSSDETVARINTDGTIQPVGEGTATITARFDGDDTYQPAEATLTLTVEAATQAIVTFDASKDKGTTTTITKDMVTISAAENNANFDLSADKYSLYGSSIMTISTSVGRIAKIELAGTSSNGYAFDLSTTEGTYQANSTKKTGTWTGSSQTVQITNKESVYAVFTSITVTVALLDDITLSGTADNSATITAYAQKRANITVGRTLTADGGWYTLCLPFSVAEDAMDVFSGATVMAFENIEDDHTLRFGRATSITAGQPYLLKPATTLTNPVFSNVRVTATEPQTVSSDYAFVGIYSPTRLSTDGTQLFLGAQGQLAKPADSSDDACTLPGLRAYFQVPQHTNAAKLSITVDGEALSIDAIHDALPATAHCVYSLQGQQLGTSTQPLPVGIYIVDGRKMVVK